ncbi:ABC transporter ATP-binding protein [Rhodococcoides kroppenstedtii]|uniref:ABC transporter ATP-binding protein n=1 Tax=Rhodococcoides kroppenstedtii TaxID=293050 RepID=UPI0036384BB6
MTGPYRPPPALAARGLSKAFAGIDAVRDVSFVVPTGSVTGLLGPNGSGKSTTLRMLLGLVHPDAGEADVAGRPLAAHDVPGRVVGAVLDGRGAHPRRTARAHLRCLAPVVGASDARVEEVLALVGLHDVAHRRTGTYSLGMRQRLALATAMLGDPAVLVLDEPANGLDPQGIVWLRDVLTARARSGRTVLVSSHLVRELEQTVDHLVIMSAGRVAFHGSLAELGALHPPRTLVASADPAALALALAAAGHTDAILGADGRLVVTGMGADGVASVARTAGVPVFGIETATTDLERIFLSMTGAPPPVPAGMPTGVRR